MQLQGASQERRPECDDELGPEIGGSGFKLFGVRLAIPSASPYMSMRKSMSMGCLSHLSNSTNSSPSPGGGDHSSLSPSSRWGGGDVHGQWGGHAACLSLSGGGGTILADGVGGGQDVGGECGDGNNGGYISDGMMPTSNNGKERKKGVPWTEEEHRLFLKGLKNLGKGDWRGIARNFVKTRTPTQVASHAQKYFLRHSNLPKRKRRSSLFDIPSDIVGCSGGEPPFKVPSRSVGLLNLSRSSSSPALHYLARKSSTNVLPIVSLGDALTPITVSIEDDEDNDDCNMNHRHYGGNFLHLWPTTEPSSPVANASSNNHDSKDIELVSGLSLTIAPPSVDNNNNMHDNQSSSSCHSNSSKNTSLISVM